MHANLRPAPVTLKSFQYDPEWVLYSDQDIIIANKPSGMLSVPGRGADRQECLLSHLQSQFSDALTVHRLDMDTSGLMVLARNKEAHRHLSRQFQERQTEKRYHAICNGQLEQPEGETCLPMRCDWERRPLQMIDFIHGKFAHTQWRLLQQFVDRFSIELTPITGRSHQLRLHMKMLGHPILGDNLYADPISLAMAPRLMLHAQYLAFTHPTSGKWLEFTQPPDFASNPQC